MKITRETLENELGFTTFTRKYPKRVLTNTYLDLGESLTIHFNNSEKLELTVETEDGDDFEVSELNAESIEELKLFIKIIK